nr:hypothetical protein [Oscillospiraceae bacterium]
MNLKAMNMFLSEDNIKKHLEHLRNEKLKYSILEKSVPELKGKSINEISRANLSRDIKEEALRLLWYIRSHETFFDSFTVNPKRSETVEKHSSSRERLVYDIFLQAKDREYGFLYVYADKQGAPRIAVSDYNEGVYLRYEPILSIDLYEHTYFSDYGFSKDKFLRNALMYLDTGRL